MLMSLQLEPYLTPTGLGCDQWAIADYVERHPLWIGYIEIVNKIGIKSTSNRPLDSWTKAQLFHPDNLIIKACRSLGLHSCPTNGGLIMNFTEVAVCQLN